MTSVFHLPELLGTIFVHLSRPLTIVTPIIAIACVNVGGPIPANEIEYEIREHPVRHLLNLKQVISTFKSAIKASKTCQQLKHLDLVTDCITHRPDMTKLALDQPRQEHSTSTRSPEI
ncbi:hypothetical protein DOTSEDRAFT_24872 [Dothistroma septosporum NZE10]|uniref:Uncharacterized protein n=1 Tax=Dothistroma septosporum (strain NZE10 / CBS 128990) TaxID=675120 RepID=M2YLT5_DOTSN|nr:hypothetical protein DOTSEDRAFT_24872 [Dothistroma septosporum NZE10]